MDVGGFKAAGPYHKIALHDDNIYISHIWHGIWAVDIQDKTNLVEKGFYSVRYAGNMAANREYVFVSASSNGLLVLRPVS